MKRDAKGRHPISKELGSLFKNQRVEKGITQVEIGEAADLSGQFVSNFERGASIVPIDKAIRMGKVLGFSKAFVVAAFVRIYLTNTCKGLAKQNTKKFTREVLSELNQQL